MSRLCDGRVCVVTGAARGIGRAYVEALATQGGRVVLNDVDRGAVGEAVDALTSSGADVRGHIGDASTAAGATELIDMALDAWGRVDAVINNAGITRDRMLINLTEADWDDVIRVHLKSTFLVTQRAAQHWRELSKAGETVDARVINTVSSVGLYGHAGQSNYGAAKGAIASFTIIASMELARYGITVNAVCPTALTSMTESVLAQTDDARSGALDPKWVAPTVVWLASDLSADVTGRVFVASGRRIAVAEGWRRGPTGPAVADPSEVDSAIRPLLAAAEPNADEQGDYPAQGRHTALAGDRRQPHRAGFPPEQVSGTPKELVEEMARRFAAGDTQGAAELFHPEIRIQQPDSLPHGGWHEGQAGMARMGAEFARHWSRTVSSPRIFGEGEGVIQVTTQTWTANSTGRSATVDVVELFGFTDGRLSEIRVFQQDTHLLLSLLDDPS